VMMSPKAAARPESEIPFVPKFRANKPFVYYPPHRIGQHSSAEVFTGVGDDTAVGLASILAQIDTASLSDTQTSLVYSAILPVKDGAMYTFGATATVSVAGLALPHGPLASFNIQLIDLPAVPEPSTLVLALLGMLGVMLLRRA
jgi:PEP-CTERM motif